MNNLNKYNGWVASSRNPHSLGNRRGRTSTLLMSTTTETIEDGTEITVPDNVVITSVNDDDMDIASKLKKENFTKTIDPTKEIDKKLKLGTGDDEIVETIVKTAKTGMGLAGVLVDDKAVVDSLKNKQDARKNEIVDNAGYVSKLRSEDQKRILDDEGLPLVYSQEGIQ